MKKHSTQSGFTLALKLALSQFCAKVFALHKNIDTFGFSNIREMHSTKRREFGSRGFSLVETLVAITILLIVITGPLAISSSSAKSSSFSSEQVAAFFLAQEGVELVEKARDDLLITYFDGSRPTPWADFTKTAAGGVYRNCYTTINSAGCDFTIKTDAAGTLNLVNCATAGNCLLYVDTASGNVRSRYTHSTSGSTISTPFTRTINLELINANEVKITSKVTWRTGALKAQQEVFVESRVFNVYGH
jgi:prepilin-type N-terminal cleavage/methylation domain-containing protein